MQFNNKLFSLLVFLLLLVINISAQSGQETRDAGNSKAGFISASSPEGSVIQVNAPTITRLPGSTFNAGIRTTTLSGQGVVSFQFDLAYDTSVIQYNSCSVVGTIGQNGSLTCGLTGTGPGGAGKVTVVVFQTMQMADTIAGQGGVLVDLNFTIVGNLGDTSPLTLTNFFYNEGTPPSTFFSGTVTAGAPTAADISLGGRVLTASGRAVSNARVSLLDGFGNVRYALTNGFGYYEFQDVTAGETYFMNVVSKRYVFAPKTVNASEQLTDLDFIAQQ